MDVRETKVARNYLIAIVCLSIGAWLQTRLVHGSGHARLDFLIFNRLFAFTDDWGAAIQLATIALAFTFAALRRIGTDLASAMARQPYRVAAITLAVCAIGSRFAYRATPFSMDEYAQTAQAYAFAQGHLTWFEPVQLLDRMIPYGFRNYFLAVNPHTGEVASMYWPGFSALLAPFAWAGVPWLLNPTLAAVSVLLIQSIAKRLELGQEGAGWAMLLSLASPVFVISSISFYSMTAHLTLNLLYVWLLLRNRPAYGLLAGLVGSVALVLHNPVPHALFAAPWLFWLLANASRWPVLFATILGYLPCTIIVGFGWPGITGAITAPDIAPVPGIEGMLSFVIAKLASVVSVPSNGLLLARIYATWKMWIWSVPGLLIFAVAAVRRARGPLLLFAISGLLTYLFYWLVPFDQGHGWGYRYFHSAWAALPLLAADYLTRPRPDVSFSRLRGWVGGVSLTSLVLANVFWFWQVHAVIEEHVAQRIPVPSTGRWVIFVTSNRGMYSWDMVQNLPFDSRVRTLMSFGSAADASLMAGYSPGAVRVFQDERGSAWRLSNSTDEGPTRAVR
jgi:hypothetical protein